MMTDAPLTPPDCDLRDFQFMPIDIARLFSSEFYALANDAEFRAGISLWLKSYHQVPAASLPSDDVALARLAELGRDLKTWRKVKATALRHWVLCSDGRLYHPVVAEKALEGWIQKVNQRKATAAAVAKRSKAVFDGVPFDQQISDSLDRLRRLSPSSRVLSKRLRRVPDDPDGAPGGRPGGSPAGASGGRPDDGPHGHPDGAPGGRPRDRDRDRDQKKEPSQKGGSRGASRSHVGAREGDPRPDDWDQPIDGGLQ